MRQVTNITHATDAAAIAALRARADGDAAVVALETRRARAHAAPDADGKPRGGEHVGGRGGSSKE